MAGQGGRQQSGSAQDGDCGRRDYPGLADEAGIREPGIRADVIAVEGNPLEDTTVLREVVFVMKDGTVFKSAK